MSETKKLSVYEKKQRYNVLVSWLHSQRYKHILNVFEEMAASNGDRPIKVVEIGCAYAELFSILNERFAIDYIGIERQSKRVAIARERYQAHANFEIVCDNAERQLAQIADADIVVALETLEHIPGPIVVRIIEEVARIKPRLFICSVPVEVGPIVWVKNVGSLLIQYQSQRSKYTWKETFWAGFGRLDKLPPHGTTHRGFDWRWLAQTLRHNMKVREMRKLPLGLLPAPLSTSVFFVAEPASDQSCPRV